MGVISPAGVRFVMAVKDARRSGMTITNAARARGIPPGRLFEAATVLDYAPELADAVLAGRLGLFPAVQEARQRKATADVPAQPTRLEMGLALVESVSPTDDCIRWPSGMGTGGYGVATANRKPIGAHRAVYEATLGPVPPGLELDHLCHTRDLTCPGGTDCPHRRCINPMHMEPVTPDENKSRHHSYWAGRTSCSKGHTYEPGTFLLRRDTARICLPCRRERDRAGQRAALVRDGDRINARRRARYAARQRAKAVSP